MRAGSSSICVTLGSFADPPHERSVSRDLVVTPARHETIARLGRPEVEHRSLRRHLRDRERLRQVVLRRTRSIATGAGGEEGAEEDAEDETGDNHGHYGWARK
jgi:hypothetical protein